MAGEETAGVAIRATTQEDQVKDGQFDAVLGSKGPHQVFLVEVGQLLGVVVVDMVGIDGVDSRSSELRRDLGQQLGLQ